MTLRDRPATLYLAALCSGLVLTAACGPNQGSSAPRESARPESAAQEPKRPAPPPPPKEDSYVAAICDEEEVVSCYEQLKFNGNIDGSVVVDIGADGAIGGVTYTGSAPKPIKDCVLSKIQDKKKVEGFEGDPLQVTCGYSGSLNNGIRMIMWSPSHKRMPKAAE
jgi:hypothetical protein